MSAPRWGRMAMMVLWGALLLTWGGCEETSSGDACEPSELRCQELCVDPETSLEHCGGCDSPCVGGPGQVAACVASTCEFTCAADHHDCNGDPADGCERVGSPCPPHAETNCADGLDNDEDGHIDCEDTDCDPCDGFEQDCGNGVDDDLDGLTDCADPDCFINPHCLPETDCGDNLDNDGDGDTDCDDIDCAASPLCLPETDCGDNLDNDGDGDTDCDDSDCAALPACAAACPTFDLGSATGDAVATGDSTGYGDDFPSTANCGSTTSSGEDVSFAWVPFTSGCFQLDTEASDYNTVLRVYDGCAGSLDRCDDDSGAATTSRLNLEAGAGVIYIIVLDGHGVGDAGSYVLDINYLGPGCP